MSLRISTCRFVVVLVVGGAAAPAWSQPTDGSVMYRCPGNDYKNTISAKEAEKLGCRKIEGAPITIIQTTKPRATATPVPTASGPIPARIDPVAQRARDSDARRILEDELKTEQDKLATMQKEFNDGQPERQGDEKNFQKYLDRVADLRAAIARKQTDIASLRREIQKLPPPLVGSQTPVQSSQ
ncbi:MAG: hypothetical protein ABJA61_00420 [Caldimonas sp.]